MLTGYCKGKNGLIINAKLKGLENSSIASHNYLISIAFYGHTYIFLYTYEYDITNLNDLIHPGAG